MVNQKHIELPTKTNQTLQFSGFEPAGQEKVHQK